MPSSGGRLHLAEGDCVTQQMRLHRPADVISSRALQEAPHGQHLSSDRHVRGADGRALKQRALLCAAAHPRIDFALPMHARKADHYWSARVPQVVHRDVDASRGVMPHAGRLRDALSASIVGHTLLARRGWGRTSDQLMRHAHLGTETPHGL